MLDALGQTKQYGYAQDNLLTSIVYLNAVNTTPNVSFTYDPYFTRRTSMIDGTGTTTYAYVPVGSPGALQLQQESGALANSAIAYSYDALGRRAARNVAGAGAETFGYDSIGRLTSHTSDLGAFTLSYLGQTSQITLRQLASSTLSTTLSYLPNSEDRRLSSIANTGLTSGQFSTYGYSTTPENFTSAISETSDSGAVYPSALTQTASYNNLNQLTDLSGQALTFDADGNLLSDGQRNYSWDAENRLIGIAYLGQSGKQTAFTYDGLSRRTAITSTPAGGSATTTSYLWCGSAICQARNASNTSTRGYYAEGEFVPGTPVQFFYYGLDQIGTARRVFASTSSAPAYGYDPYGRALQSTTPLTDFNYAGMFYNAESGLYLTQYRAYDPAAGRWLTRDPAGESTDSTANLYGYVEGDPIGHRDPQGLTGGTIAIGVEIGSGAGPVGAIVGGIVGAALGAAAIYAARPAPENANDPNGPKAPGKPGEAEGFSDPKDGETWVPNPNPGQGGSKYGWQDNKGRVWCPTGPARRAHGGPHWDVQLPGGGYVNVRPGQNIND
ncbi:RHS repeat-associated core domain-containing protein [Bradyrhizobium iriomotense]|uniref:RHS repeat-associated core domain-containing protein n=1 Tax=Bradyrhizobium iriomotense TaxID=441950 RepID=UPI0024E06D2B|nr:RHS repeat-associated core domain-containing protein [Bradyrhizobium iriomotense]